MPEPTDFSSKDKNKKQSGKRKDTTGNGGRKKAAAAALFLSASAIAALSRARADGSASLAVTSDARDLTDLTSATASIHEPSRFAAALETAEQIGYRDYDLEHPYALPVDVAATRIPIQVKGGVKNFPQTPAIRLDDRSSVGVKVTDATVFAARIFNPNNENDWVQINFVTPSIQSKIWDDRTGNVGVYITASFLGNEKLGLASHATFLHEERDINSNKPGGLAVRVMRGYDAERKTSGFEVQYPHTKGGFAVPWTYADVNFDKNTPGYDFETGYNTDAAWNSPGQTQWQTESTFEHPWFPKFEDPAIQRIIKQCNAVKFITNGKITITREQQDQRLGLGLLSTAKPTLTPTTRTRAPTVKQTPKPTGFPTREPTKAPTTAYPTKAATPAPTGFPSKSAAPTSKPTKPPTKRGRKKRG